MLVKPLIPTNIYELIGQATSTSDDTVTILRRALEELDYESFDLSVLEECKHCMSALENCLDLAKKNPALIHQKSRAETQLFACYLVESLLNLRIHAAREARTALQKARTLSKSNGSSIDKKIALESLGLVDALVCELENKLNKIEPCIFSRRFIYDA